MKKLNIGWKICVALMLLGGAAWGGEADDQGVGSTIEIKPVLTQPLPREVQTVYVGPDDRAWMIVPSGSYPGDAAAEMEITEQFSQKQPRLTLSTPVLFEDSGRVWFIVNANVSANVKAAKTLLGYDGKDFVRKTAGKDDGFRGDDPKHNGTVFPDRNVIVDNKLFFPTCMGVYCFDGQDWSFQKMFDLKSKYADSAPHLVPSRDGKGLWAALSASGDVKNPFPTTVWYFRDGAWKQIPFEGGLKVPAFLSAAAVGDELWLAYGAGFMDVAIVNHASNKKFTVEELVAQLSDEDWEKRERATTTLIEEGEDGRADLETIDHQANVDPETSARVRDILQQLDHPKKRPFIAGHYKVLGIRMLQQDAAGNVYLGAGSITKGDDTQQLGPGLIVFKKAGGVAFFGPEQFHQQVPAENWFKPLPIDAQRVWFAGNEINSFNLMLDLKENKLLTSTASPFASKLLATDSKGKLFYRSASVFQSQPIILDQPGLPDDRKKLAQVMAFTNDFRDIAVSPEGDVFVDSSEKGISRFDGEKLQPLPAAAGYAGMQVTQLLAGRDGALLLLGPGTFGDKEAALCVDGAMHHGKTVKQLLVEQHDAIVKHFNCGPLTTLKGQTGDLAETMTLLVDQRQNIWFLDNGHLSVAAGNQWLDAAPPVQPGPPQGFRSLFDVGEGGAIYATYGKDADADRPAYSSQISIQDGKAVLKDLSIQRQPSWTEEHTAPQEMPRSETKDHQVSIWIPATRPWPSAPDDPKEELRGQPTIARYDGAGQAPAAVTNGRPLLIDDAGYLWVKSGKPDTLQVWRDGENICDINVPGLEYGTKMFSDALGSVYVWTSLGLRHLSAAAGGNGQYTLGQLYVLDQFNMRAISGWFGYSRSLHMVIVPGTFISPDTVGPRGGAAVPFMAGYRLPPPNP